MNPFWFLVVKDLRQERVLSWRIPVAMGSNVLSTVPPVLFGRIGRQARDASLKEEIRDVYHESREAWDSLVVDGVCRIISLYTS